MTTAPISPAVTPGRRILAGGFRVFLAESLIIPTGLLTAAYLARRLGPDGYGVFTVAAAVVAWVEWSITAVFSRAAVRFVADATDWRPIGATIVSAHLALSVAAAALLWILAAPVAALLETPALAGPLRLFSLDIPLFCLAQAHRNILIGIGSFGERAMAAAARWISRLLLVVVLVEAGLSVEGAILGSIGASLVELAVCRWFVRPAFSVQATRRIGRLWEYVAPLLLSAIALRLYDRLDLMALSALGGTVEQAGHYGAAQNLSILPSLLALSFVPLLLATLTRAFREGDLATAGHVGRQSLRGVLLLLPLAGLAAGAAPEIVALVFGPAFAPAAGPLPPLLFAAVFLVLVSVATAVLVAAGRPRLTAAITVPLPIVAALGYAAIIPRFGPRGAAVVTLACAVLAAIAMLVIVRKVCGIAPPALTLARSGLTAAGAYAAAALWPASGATVLLELAAITLGVLVALVASGEVTRAELSAARSWWIRRRSRPT
jgi:O-antigen/teichoic acid export membrane protein